MKPVKKLFIIDDDQTFVFLTKKSISSTNIESNINEFSDGSEAIDYLKTIATDDTMLPDIILLDLFMPIMDGWGFLEEYKLLHPHLPKKADIYIVSSTIAPHDIERAKSHPLVKDLFIKPLVRDKIIELLNSD